MFDFVPLASERTVSAVHRLPSMPSIPEHGELPQARADSLRLGSDQNLSGTYDRNAQAADSSGNKIHKIGRQKSWLRKKTSKKELIESQKIESLLTDPTPKQHILMTTGTGLNRVANVLQQAGFKQSKADANRFLIHDADGNPHAVITLRRHADSELKAGRHFPSQATVVDTQFHSDVPPEEAGLYFDSKIAGSLSQADPQHFHGHAISEADLRGRPLQEIQDYDPKTVTNHNFLYGSHESNPIPYIRWEGNETDVPFDER